MRKRECRSQKNAAPNGTRDGIFARGSIFAVHAFSPFHPPDQERATAAGVLPSCGDSGQDQTMSECADGGFGRSTMTIRIWKSSRLVGLEATIRKHLPNSRCTRYRCQISGMRIGSNADLA